MFPSFPETKTNNQKAKEIQTKRTISNNVLQPKQLKPAFVGPILLNPQVLFCRQGLGP